MLAAQSSPREGLQVRTARRLRRRGRAASCARKRGVRAQRKDLRSRVRLRSSRSILQHEPGLFSFKSLFV